MGGSNKKKDAKSIKRAIEPQGSTGKAEKSAKKAKAILNAEQPSLPTSSKTKTKTSKEVKMANLPSVIGLNTANQLVMVPMRVTNETSENNNALPSKGGSRSRSQSQETEEREKLRELRDSIKESLTAPQRNEVAQAEDQNGQPIVQDDGQGTEGCSNYVAQPVRRLTRSIKQRKIIQAQKEFQAAEREADQIRIAERTTLQQVDRETPVDPDGVSLSVSEDEYQDEIDDDSQQSQDEQQGEDETVDEQTQASSSSSSESDMETSSSSSSDDEMDLSNLKIKKKYKKDPNYKRVLESLMVEKLKRKRARDKARRKSRKLKALKKKEKRAKRDRRGNNVMTTPIQQVAKVPVRNVARPLLVKSPSDSTLYNPALKRLRPNEESFLNLPERIIPDRTEFSSNVIEKISNFVDSIRLEQTHKEAQSDTGVENTTQQRRPVHDDQPRSSRDEEEERARKISDKVILESEKFKANLVAPTGTLPIRIDSSIELLRKFDNDDDFFHISCHVDQSLRAKIEKGEFVELERLLPNDRAAGGMSMNQENRLGLVHEGGEMFLAPAKKLNRINSVRRWDDAFRIYATIFTQSNPDRASELLQYVQVIHTAAANNSWDSVAFYDFTFRQLMAVKPWRSWAKTYTQGWNIAFSHGSGKPVNFNSGGNNGGGGSSFSKSNAREPSKDWRDDCCWRFNKNRCSKTSRDCNWDHRCKFCGGWQHSYNDCRKRQQRGNNSSNNSYNIRGGGGGSSSYYGGHSSTSSSTQGSASNNSNKSNNNKK